MRQNDDKAELIQESIIKKVNKLKYLHKTIITGTYISLILFSISCNPVNKTDLNAAKKVLESIGGHASLYYTEFALNELNDFNKIVDLQIERCHWIEVLNYDKNIVASYAAFHLYRNLSSETKNNFEAIKISFDNKLVDDISGKYTYTMAELDFLKNAFSTTKIYLSNLLKDHNNFNPLDFIQSESLSEQKIDSINTQILNEINNKILRVDLFCFGDLESDYVAILSMIEFNPDEFHVVRFVFNKNNSEIITYIGQ